MFINKFTMKFGNKKKTNLKRKSDGKRVMSAGLSAASAFTNRISASCQMFRQGKWYWSKDSLDFCNSSVVTLIRMSDAPVTLVDNYWFQAMWTTHDSKCKPSRLAKVKTIVKSNFKEQKLKLKELIDIARKVYFKFV